jgi:hypothetical protein
MVLPPRDTRGCPGVMKSAGMAIKAVKIGTKIRILFRKKPGGTFDARLISNTKTNIPPSTGRLCTRLTVTIKSKKDTNFTRGSRLCNNPGARLMSSVEITDSSTRVNPAIFLVRKSSPFNLEILL